MSTEQFSGIVVEWLETAKDPRFDRIYTDLVYQPMNGCRLHSRLAEKPIASRPSKWWGPTSVAKFTVGEDGPVLMKTAEVEVLNDGPASPRP